MAQPVTSAADAADVLIVGAGPAGATASLFLGDKGIPHTVVDRLQFPRDKVDGNVFGSKVLAVTAALSDQTLTQAILQSPHLHHCWHGAHIFGDRGSGTRVLRSNRATVAQAGSTAPLVTAPLMTAPSMTAPLMTMSRLHFDHLLVQHLNTECAQTHFGWEIAEIVRRGDRLQATLRQGERTQVLNPRLIVGADGTQSIVLKTLGQQSSGGIQPRQPETQAIHAYFTGVTGFERDPHVEGHFLRQIVPGFVYVVPLANGVVKVGLGSLSRRIERQQIDLEALFWDLIKNHPRFAPRFRSAQQVGTVERWSTRLAIPNSGPLSGDNYLLLGDAAGVSNPFTGFGTGNAMISGQIAAAYIERAIAQQRFDSASLSAYDAELHHQFQSEFTVGLWLHRLTRYPWFINRLANSLGVRRWVKRLLPTGNFSPVKAV
ncbi:MAG: NAD(P)/FAD-dependent oxidoreductase [Cyanobacteria bacterium P01_H01_bin.119]